MSFKFAHDVHPPEIMAELEKNQSAYDEVKEDMETNHWGRLVLLSNGKVIDIYNDEKDACAIGNRLFGLGNFSVIRVGERPTDLGFNAIPMAVP